MASRQEIIKFLTKFIEAESLIEGMHYLIIMILYHSQICVKMLKFSCGILSLYPSSRSIHHFRFYFCDNKCLYVTHVCTLHINILASPSHSSPVGSKKIGANMFLSSQE